MQSEISLNKNKGNFDNVDRWLILRARIYEERLKSAFHLFRENGIEPILIKGWAIAKEYPQQHQRVFNDLDLCVSPGLFDKGQRLLALEDFRKLNIDLHCGLRHLDTLEWDDLFENSVLVELDDVQVRILRPEDHLRILCVHWLTDGGAYKERLLDIYHLLENNAGRFDWNRCLGKVSQVRQGWIGVTIGAIRKYYNLDVSGIPIGVKEKSLPRWFIRTLEKEWASNTKLKPIHTLLQSRRELWRQIKKRVPPNAVQATIDMEGEFDDAPRFYYQVGSVFLRLKPSVRRVYNSLKLYFKK